LSSSVCEAQSVTHPSVVPILHFSTRPLCRKSFKRRALKLTVGVETVWRDFEDHGGGKRRPRHGFGVFFSRSVMRMLSVVGPGQHSLPSKPSSTQGRWHATPLAALR
jgi:hypothetical protein